MCLFIRLESVNGGVEKVVDWVGFRENGEEHLLYLAINEAFLELEAYRLVAVE